MSFILNLETSSKNCSVSLSSNGDLIDSFDLEDQNYRHSELLTSSIQNILTENNLNVEDLSAISVGIGPGSFTGLRIGLSVAKGLCYPHKINLISIPSLKILANSVSTRSENTISLINDKGNYYYISMYNNELDELFPAKIQLIDNDYMDSIIDTSTNIIVNTSDAFNFINKLVDNKVNVIKRTISSINMIELSHNSLNAQIFEDIAYIEPMYVKKPYVN